jgi:threonylcarbamoyladenosine tRNA methylthiotransferase MtaB
MKVYLASLGCKLNQSEIETLARELAAHGHQVATEPSTADAIVLNTCAVTQVAVRKSAQLARRLYRESHGARLILTGCFAELSPEEAGALPGLERVVGNRDKERLLEILQASLPAVPIVRPTPALVEAVALRTRASVKIQDGCDNECTYCIVRYARGPQRSRPLEQITAEIRARLASGYQEIVLTGVHIGSYGRDRGQVAANTDLWGLVREILHETQLPRLRLSSIEPWDITVENLRVWTEPRLCRHLHLPLQSGCDDILAHMKRRYTAGDFAQLVEAARQVAPEMAITTDVIVGFPGETDAQFQATLRFVEAMQFARVHIFPYSSRPGTPAAGWPDQVPADVKRARSQALQEVARTQAAAFRGRFVGQTMEVLWETRGATGEWSGLTDNYVRVFAPYADDLHNKIVPVYIMEVASLALRGEVVPPTSGR